MPVLARGAQRRPEDAMQRTWVAPWREIFHMVHDGAIRRRVNVEIYRDRVRVFVEGPGGGSRKLLSLDTVSANRRAP